MMGPSPEVSGWRAEQEENLLRTVQWNWGDAYVISVKDGRWKAVRRDDGGVVRASSADKLRDAIFRDYDARPVPRDLGTVEFP